MKNEEKKIVNEKIKMPFIVVLLGVLIIIAAIFLPYMTAQGTLLEKIELLNSLELDEMNIDPQPTILSVAQVFDTLYGDRSGQIAKTIVSIFLGLLAIVAVFVLFKKPIAIMLFELPACGVFLFLNYAIQEDLLGSDKYVWDIGYYMICAAMLAIFAGAVWMLVKKIIAKRELKTAKQTEQIAIENN